MANKVKFGLKNIHIFPVKEETLKKVTYDVPFKLPGAVSLSMDPAGDSDTFYADDIPYYAETTNSGYEGDLEVALINEDFETKVLGYVKDKFGAIIENVDVTSKRFAMAFEIKGDNNVTRHILYYCSVARPKTEANTKESKTKVATDKLKITMLPHPVTGNIKAKVSQDVEAQYNTFYENVYEPNLESGV